MQGMDLPPGAAIDADNFHTLCIKAYKAMGLEAAIPPREDRGASARFWNDEAPLTLFEAITSGRMPTYDVIIVDEGQDFAADWWVHQTLVVACRQGEALMTRPHERRSNESPPKQDLDRITFDPHIMGGRPSVRGMRVTVGTLVGLLAAGHSRGEILETYPYVEAEDITQALSYAAWRAEEIDVPLATA